MSMKILIHNRCMRRSELGSLNLGWKNLLGDKKRSSKKMGWGGVRRKGYKELKENNVAQEFLFH
jgi:hypothetical protein